MQAAENPEITKKKGSRARPGRTRVNVFVDDNLLARIDARYPEIGSRTDRINFILKRYMDARRGEDD